MDVQELFRAQEGETIDIGKVIQELKKGRLKTEPDVSASKEQLDPLQHQVFNKIKRPDKRVRIDADELAVSENVISVTAGTEQAAFRMEPVARIALALQKLIVKRAVSFLFGNPVSLEVSTANESQANVKKAVERVLYDVKERSLNRRVARHLFSSTEVAEVWYPVEETNERYGFNSKTKLRCGIFSPLNGDTLYPYFDETGDMVAFSREFEVSLGNNKVRRYFETYTADFTYQFVQGEKGYEIVVGFPKANPIKKIPVIYAEQAAVEWADVQILIERLETLLSNFADTNDYHASPKIFVTGEVTGFSRKGETGAIIEGDENSTAQYLAWQNAPESVKLEIETLLRMIHTITQTPDISFDSIKGIGAVSGIALKLMFMDAHLKVQEHCEIFDDYLQRRINVVKAFIGEMNQKMKAEADKLMIEPVITPYMIVDEAAELKIWQDANGGNPVISQKASFAKAGLTADPDADFKQYQDEQSAKTAFMLGEPMEA
jgi:hypothetical protein